MAVFQAAGLAVARLAELRPARSHRYHDGRPMEGFCLITSDSGFSRVTLHVENGQTLTDRSGNGGFYYEGWLVGPAGVVSLGAFNLGPDGRGSATRVIAESHVQPGRAEFVRVTVEPFGGSADGGIAVLEGRLVWLDAPVGGSATPAAASPVPSGAPAQGFGTGPAEWKSATAPGFFSSRSGPAAPFAGSTGVPGAGPMLAGSGASPTASGAATGPVTGSTTAATQSSMTGSTAAPALGSAAASAAAQAPGSSAAPTAGPAPASSAAPTAGPAPASSAPAAAQAAAPSAATAAPPFASPVASATSPTSASTGVPPGSLAEEPRRTAVGILTETSAHPGAEGGTRQFGAGAPQAGQFGATATGGPAGQSGTIAATAPAASFDGAATTDPAGHTGAVAAGDPPGHLDIRTDDPASQFDTRIEDPAEQSAQGHFAAQPADSPAGAAGQASAASPAPAVDPIPPQPAPRHVNPLSVQVQLVQRHPMTPRATGTATINLRRGHLSLSLRGLPSPTALGRDRKSGRPFNAYRVWLINQKNQMRTPVGYCERVWGENFRFEADGLPLNRSDTILITAEDRSVATSTGHPAPQVLIGSYDPRM